MQALDIQTFTYEHRQHVLIALTTAFGSSGGWIVDRKTLSATSTVFHVEIQLRSILDLYAALLATGVELTPAGHETFTALCTRRQHMRLTSELGQIIVLRLEVSFLEDVTLHSLLFSNSSVA